MNDYTEPLPQFENEEAAATWMYEYLDDPCTDNYRLAYLNNLDEMGNYFNQRDNGCCGYFDRRIVIGGEEAFIGCNYGH